MKKVCSLFSIHNANVLFPENMRDLVKTYKLASLEDIKRKLAHEMESEKFSLFFELPLFLDKPNIMGGYVGFILCNNELQTLLKHGMKIAINDDCKVTFYCSYVPSLMIQISDSKLLFDINGV